MAEKFHERFQISLPIEEAKRRFVNRAHSFLLNYNCEWMSLNSIWNKVHQNVAYELGEKFDPNTPLYEPYLETYTRLDFRRTLQAIEEARKTIAGVGGAFQSLDAAIIAVLLQSEVDLGIRWHEERFYPSGAALLDESLVNDNLHWLRAKRFQTVLEPFEKALHRLLHAHSQPEFLSDVIKDAKEALEALAKIVTGKEGTLDQLVELFLSRIHASNEYKALLKDYCDYANKFRHGTSAPEKKPSLSYAEAESFIYLTGLFIRLVISAGFASSAAV